VGVGGSKCKRVTKQEYKIYCKLQRTDTAFASVIHSNTLINY